MAPEYRVEIVPPAAADLDDIFRYIAQDSFQNASAMIDKLLATIELLAIFPYRHGPLQGSRKSRENFRSAVVYPYIIDYQVNEEKSIVYVMQVRHGAREHFG